MKEQLKKYNEIKDERGLMMSEFRELLMLYPILAVLNADGRIDSFEKHFFNKQIKKRYKEKKDFNLLILQEEVKYTIENYEKMSDVLLQALYVLNKEENLSEYILDVMVTAAGVSMDSFGNNLLYSQEVPAWLQVPRSIFGVFIKPDKNKKGISEQEKEMIVRILEGIDAMTERNIKVLEKL